MLAAQQCNEDVLEEIFSLLSKSELASAARVCLNWLPIARMILYRTLLFRQPSASASNLAQTLPTNPSLRNLIRRLTLHYDDPETQGGDAILNWLSLIPGHKLRSIIFEGQFLCRTDLDHILTLPAISTVPCIIARSPTTPAQLLALFNMSQLASLSVVIDGPSAPLSCVTLPNLKKLTLVIGGEFAPIITSILNGLSVPLEQLDLVFLADLEQDSRTLQDSLSFHAPHLKHFALHSGPYYPTLPLADNYIATFTSLRKFHCENCSYTPRLISQLPPTLVCLTVTAPLLVPFPDKAFSEALEKNFHRLTSLRRIRVIRDSWPLLRCPMVAEFCQSKGIDFAVVNRGDLWHEYSWNTD